MGEEIEKIHSAIHCGSHLEERQRLLGNIQHCFTLNSEKRNRTLEIVNQVMATQKKD